MLPANYGCYPVFLPPGLLRLYYGGFANRTLWPLFHSFPMYARYASDEWRAYREANDAFADRVARVVNPRDTIWVHDYHLLLLPEMLRERLPHARIGFFLHIPFPAYDVFRLLPWSRDVLRGMLGADLVGFHTYDYSQSFLRSVRRLLGPDNELGRVTWGHRVVQSDVFPMGVDVARLEQTNPSPPSREVAQRLRGPAAHAKLAFSISRLDYTKGIPEALRAVEELLSRFPRYRTRLVYVLVVVPSRERVDRYALLKREVDELVGRINSRFGSLDWVPIRYMYRQLHLPELLALYREADIALVTPLRDGMNLVAKEYTLAHADGSGVLILSELTGAAKELTESLLVNPNNVDEIVSALRRALEMPREEQIARNKPMRDRLRAYDATRWHEKFLGRLDDVVSMSEGLNVRTFGRRELRLLLHRYARSARRLLLLDYDGTLVPIRDDPATAAPTIQLLQTLAALAANKRNHVVIVSGRRKEDLERWLDSVPATLVAEHGAWVRGPKSRRWQVQRGMTTQWMSRIRPVLELFVDRVPGARIEEKDFSLAWHYRLADPESGGAAAMELVDALTALTANLDLHVIQGHRVVEIKSTNASKGHFYKSRLERGPWDFVLAAGDDATDESLFPMLPPDAVSLRIGLVASAARFNMRGPSDVLRLLGRLAGRPGG